MKTKYCPGCNTTKSTDDFFKNARRRDGLNPHCRVCAQARTSAQYRAIRNQAIEAIGGPICARCGFDDGRALTIDHKDGGGTEHRRQSSPRRILRHVIAHPKEYRVLCWNCQAIRRAEEGQNSSRAYRERVLSMSPRSI